MPSSRSTVRTASRNPSPRVSPSEDSSVFLPTRPPSITKPPDNQFPGSTGPHHHVPNCRTSISFPTTNPCPRPPTPSLLASLPACHPLSRPLPLRLIRIALTLTNSSMTRPPPCCLFPRCSSPPSLASTSPLHAHLLPNPTTPPPSPPYFFFHRLLLPTSDDFHCPHRRLQRPYPYSHHRPPPSTTSPCCTALSLSPIKVATPPISPP